MEDTKNPVLTPNVPPPPAEVKVRTMKSDIEGVAKAGGGLPQFKTVAVEGMGLPKSRVGTAPVPSTPVGTAKVGFPWWIVAIALVVLGVLLWFGYTFLLKK
jgi:hypothetical protein